VTGTTNHNQPPVYRKGSVESFSSLEGSTTGAPTDTDSILFSPDGNEDHQQRHTTLPNIVHHGTGDSNSNQVTPQQHKTPPNGGGGFPKAPMLAMIEERSFESQASVDSPVLAPTTLNKNSKTETANTISKPVMSKPPQQRTHHHLSAAYHYDEKRPLVRLNSIDTETPESSSDAESGDLRSSLRNSNSNNNIKPAADLSGGKQRTNNQVLAHHNNSSNSQYEKEWLISPQSGGTSVATSDTGDLIDTSIRTIETTEDMFKA